MTDSGLGVLDKTPATVADTAIAKVHTRAELIEIVAVALDRRGTARALFRSLYRNIEGTDDDTLKAVSTTDSSLEPVVNALNESGHETGDTVGDVMRVMSLSRDDIHALVCYCHGDSVSGADLAARFRSLPPD